MGRELPFVGFMWTNTVASVMWNTLAHTKAAWVVVTLCVGRNMSSFLVKQLVNRCQAGYLFFAPLSQSLCNPTSKANFLAWQSL